MVLQPNRDTHWTNLSLSDGDNLFNQTGNSVCYVVMVYAYGYRWCVHHMTFLSGSKFIFYH